MKHRSGFRQLLGLSVLIVSPKALAVTVGAYAVADHSICGISNIPGTIEELDKFFASPNFPSDMQANFYWKNARVRQSEWSKSGDYKTSTETSTGFDGVDSSVLSYIASHGVTSGGIYKALSGSRSDGGCYMSSTDMELGNQNARYIILSTCQGLKVGTGYDPTAAGENPSRTWKNSARGVNCIFGYSNNMADANGYGEFLLAGIKDGKTPLVSAFLAASEAVSVDNIPAALCFGADANDAQAYMSSNKTFETTSRQQTASAWVYRKSAPTKSANQFLTQTISPTIQVSTIALNPQTVAAKFLGKHLTRVKNGAINTFSSPAGTASFDPTNNLLIVRNELTESAKLDPIPTETEAIEIAAHAIKITGLAAAAGQFVQSSAAEDVMGGESGILRVISRKIRFSQVLAGLSPINQAGSIEVTVGPGGAVSEVRASLLKVQQRSGTLLRTAALSNQIDDYESQAIQLVGARVPQATFRVIGTRLGYDTGSFFGVNTQAKAVAEVTVEASEKGLARRYIEKIEL